LYSLFPIIPLFFSEEGLAGMVLTCSPPVSNVEEV
jgi:hypothetical protein